MPALPRPTSTKTIRVAASCWGERYRTVQASVRYFQAGEIAKDCVLPPLVLSALIISDVVSS